MPPITSVDVLMFLYILVGIMLVVVLYHALFLFVDLRRVMKRVERLTSQVEQVILKPLAIADQALNAIMELFQHGAKKKGKNFDHRKVD
ncbi:MAG: hypothetical protein PHW10_03795 [Candidatus Peribacteraceae bacterium]|nr:hypothetical protein [Candidatus Peribacteraceae bacterium]